MEWIILEFQKIVRASARNLWNRYKVVLFKSMWEKCDGCEEDKKSRGEAAVLG